MSHPTRPTRAPRERVLLCGVRGVEEDADIDEDLSEASGLVVAAEADVVGEGVIQRKLRPDPATLFGKGKVEEVRTEVHRLHPDAVIVDNDLTPAQIRNLEKSWGVRVVDRSELILDIFASRAQSRQARLQVELAQSEYLAPRLRRMWTHLERTEGAIGTRGPGETQLETDKRLLRRRIQVLREELREIEERKLREVETRRESFTIGLVGYTNTGKSTLLNRLTGSKELVADQLFATLDTRTRQWRLRDGRTVLLSDTVGFLRRLPHHLVASFHATLEETLAADLLLHVIDASHPQAGVQIETVDRVVCGLSRRARPGILVFNKIDRVDDRIGIQLLRNGRREDVVYVSAMTGEGLDRLDESVSRKLDQQSSLVDLHFPIGEGRLNALVHRMGRPLEDEMSVNLQDRRLRIRLTDAALGNLRRTGGPALRIEIVEAASSSVPEPTSTDPPRDDGETAPGRFAAEA